MLRNVSHGTSSNALVSGNLSLRALSTWLESNHVPLTSTPGSQRFASTRHAPRKRAEKETSLLPRYMRRQALQQDARKLLPSKAAGKEKAPATPVVKAVKAAPTFRSRHYDPEQETAPKSEIRLLEPHILSTRLKKLSDAGKVEDAIFMLKNAPLDAQNTQVWNTMIWETLKVGRYSLAYQLFVDMKRRGFSPSLRTYQTLFNGLARIDNWVTHTKQLTNARALYDSFQRHITSVKKHSPDDPELTISPLAPYIRILGNAGEYQTIFDIYYSLDKEGPLAPDQFIYSAMFQAIHAAMGDTVEGSVKVAADARMLWNQMIKASRKNEALIPDSHTVRSALIALAGGNEMDHELAFKIVTEYYGLDSNKISSSQTGKIPLTPESLAAVLRLCTQTKNYPLCAQFYQQVRRRPEAVGGISIIDRGHMEEILRADIALKGPGLGYHALQHLEWMLRQEITGPNGPKLRPGLSTYTLVMQACSVSADWNSATRTFDLMTGYHAHDFMDGATSADPRLDNRGPGRSFPPNTEFMSFMLKAAVATRNMADIRQVLRIVDHIGYDTILATRGDVKHETMKIVKRRGFIEAKFASTVREAVDMVMDGNGKHARGAEVQAFMALGKRAMGKDDASTSVGKARRPSRRTKSKPAEEKVWNTAP